MFDWFWKGVAGLASLLALAFGFNAARTKRRMEREKTEREEAMRRLCDEASRQLAVTRKHHAEQPPINPITRKDFE